MEPINFSYRGWENRSLVLTDLFVSLLWLLKECFRALELGDDFERTVDDNVRGLDPKNNGQGQALFELSIEAVATSTHLNTSIR